MSWIPVVLIVMGVGLYARSPVLPASHEIPSLTAREWDKLPVTAILKAADPKLDAYFAKQTAYVKTLNEFMMVQSPEYAKRLMVDLRHDPFFPPACICAYRVCYETILMEGSVPRATVLQMFPANRAEILENYGETITFPEALRVLKLKLGTC
jgi:hypothetical protein